MSTKVEHRAICVNRIGWYKNAFVLPDQTFGDINEQVIYQAEIISQVYKQSGTLADWRSKISELCIGNSRLVLAISCAFAAMLLKFIGNESGGLHFVGASSIGKTTALRIAASVFGPPNYVSRWRATINGLEAIATERSDTLLILDELAQIDPKEAGEVAYLLANGMGKSRANKSGSAKSRQEWRILFLSAGEVNLEQHMREGGKKITTGQEVRLVDIPADTQKGLGIFETIHGYPSAAAFSKTLLETSSHHYGVAAFDFLKQITSTEILSTLPQTIKKLCDEFLLINLPKNAGGQVQRVCERFGLIAAAGEIASQLGITGWPIQEASLAAKICFQEWLTQRGSVDNSEKSKILSQIKCFFETHGESRFSDWNDFDSKTVNRAGFKKLKNGQLYFYTFPETFNKEICAGLDVRTATRILIDAGWILPSKNGSPYRKERLPNLGQSRCYVFTSKIWKHETQR